MLTTTAYTQKSYWLNTYGPYTPNGPLQGDLTVDVAIVGGGYTGLATAYFLKQAEPTLRVAVLEGEVVGYGAIGQVGDARAWYSLGCVGHGVAPTRLNGQTLADLLLEKKTDLTSIWFVNRRTIPWPPEPLRWVASQAILGYMHAEDWWYERGMKDEG